MDKLGKRLGKIMYGRLPNSEDAWYAANIDGNWLTMKQFFRIILCGKKQSKILSKIFTRHIFFRIKRCQITLERLAKRRAFSMRTTFRTSLCPFIQRSELVKGNNFDFFGCIRAVAFT